MRSTARSSRLAPLLVLIAATAPSSAQVGDVRRVHDPCVIADGNTFYLLCTGGGLAIRRSADLFRWERAGTVFTDIPAWTREEVPGVRGLWAPDVSFFNGRYHVYYSVSTFGGNRSCIGLAVNATLDAGSPRYCWEDLGKVVESRPGQDDWNAIDPNIVLDDRGRPWLAFGSFWSGIKLRPIDPQTGKPPADSPLYALAARPAPGAIEAPFILRYGGHYYLFVSFDLCCRGAQSTYRVMVGRAKEVTGPYVDRDGKPMREGGGTEVLAGQGAVRGPGHNAVLAQNGRHWLVHHYYDAQQGGIATLQIRPLNWDADGWPVAGLPLTTRPASAATQDAGP